MRRRRPLVALAWLLLSLAAAAAFASDADAFGKIVLGLRLRASAPPVPTGELSVMGVVTTDIENTRDAAIDAGDFASRPILETADGGELPAGLAVVPSIDPLLWPGGRLEAGASRALRSRFLRLAEDVPAKVSLRSRMFVFDTEGRAQQVVSPAFDVALGELRLARALAPDDLPEDGNLPVFLNYHDHGGIEGGQRALEVRPDGTAIVSRRTHGDPREDDPAGCWSVRLTVTEITDLTRALHAAKAWELADLRMRTMLPDESWVQLTTTAGDAVLHVEFPVADAADRDGWQTLGKHLDALGKRLVRRGLKGPR